MGKPITIRQALVLAIALTVASTVVGAGALYGYQLYRSRRAIEAIRVTTLGEVYATQLVSLLTNPAGIQQSDLQKIVWDPDVCLAALLTEHDEPFVLRGGANLLQEFFQKAGPDPVRPTVLAMHRKSTPPLPELYMAAVPVRPVGGKQTLAMLVIGARALDQNAGSAHQVWVFLCKLGLIGVGGIGIGLWWLKREVLDPIARLARAPQQPTFAALPVDREDEIGTVARVLSGMHEEVDEWRNRAEKLERSVDSRVAAATKRVASELQRAESQVYTDPLTELGNRRLLEEKFASVFHGQRSAGQDLSVVMLDIDYFKTLNDTLGHRAGDHLLQFTGDLLRQCLRPQDLAVRYGGDEFVLILPAVTAKDARTIAERTVRLFAQQARLLEVNPKPSMSGGVASLWQHEPETPEGLLAIADEALYLSKRSGKSCVHIYGQHEPAMTG